MMQSNPDPHGEQPVLQAGAPIAEARAAVILVHGRGGSAEDILGLAQSLRRDDLAFIAPQASAHSWYPYSFLTPMEQNEPGLSSALERLDTLVRMLETKGFPATRVALLGFSQGACLSLEFAARHARRYGAVIGFSGGLIGPPGTPREYGGSLDGTPVFLGCSDVDPHIPLARVHETAAVLEQLGAAVDERIYPQMGHTVNREELDAAAALLAAVPRW
jgi:predicted esterase